MTSRINRLSTTRAIMFILVFGMVVVPLLVGAALLGDIDNFENTVRVQNEQEIFDAIDLYDDVEIILENDVNLTTHALEIPVGKRVALSGPYSLTAQGGFDAVIVEGELHIKDITVTRGEGIRGRGVGILPEGIVSLHGGAIVGHNNNYDDNGGGVINWGTFVLISGTIADNTAFTGGGIYNLGELEVRGGDISGNLAYAVGGGIANEGTAEINGGNIENNRAQQGGGIYNSGLIRDADMAKEMMDFDGDGDGDGDEPADLETRLGILTLSDGVITQNEAFNGGGVYNLGQFVIEGGHIVENSVVDYFYQIVDESGEYDGLWNEYGRGGGVYNIGSLDMTAGEVARNKAIDGAGIYNDASHQLNQAPQDILQLADSGDGSDDGSGDSGKATEKLSSGHRINRAADDMELELNISGGIITENHASRQGGGVFNGGVLNFTGGTILSNEAFFGGGIFNAASRYQQMLPMLRGAADDAAGLAISEKMRSQIRSMSGSSETTLTVNGGTIVLNEAVFGGGVYNGANFLFKSGEIIENAAIARDLYIQWGANATDGGEITVGPGGGVYNAGYFEMTGGLVARNDAQDGGGVFNELDFERMVLALVNPQAQLSQANQLPQAMFDLDGDEGDGDGIGDDDIRGNDDRGYPFYFVSSEGYFEFLGGIIQDNTATENGGGIFNGGWLRLAEGSKIIGNTAGVNGGGLFIKDVISENLSDSESRIRDVDMAEEMINLTRGGPAAFEPFGDDEDGDEEDVQNVRVIFEYSFIADNVAGASGGGIYHSGQDTLTIESVEIVGNVAVEHGGGISMAGGAELIVLDGLFKDNVAAHGGAISMHTIVDEDEANMLENLLIDAHVAFSGNKANVAYNRLPADDLLYSGTVFSTAWTSPFTQGYNNFDIHYVGDVYQTTGGPIIPDGGPGGQGTGGSGTQGTDASGLPRTGDMTHILWLVLLIIIAAGVTTYVVKKRSSRAEDALK